MSFIDDLVALGEFIDTTTANTIVKYRYDPEYIEHMLDIPGNDVGVVSTYFSEGNWRRNFSELLEGDGSNLLMQDTRIPMEFNGLLFQSIEHLVGCAKADYFKDSASFKRILSAPTPLLAMRYAREVNGYKPRSWCGLSSLVMVGANILKFANSEICRETLIRMGDRGLITFANPYDKRRGTGMGVSDPRTSDPRQWVGDNHLGFIQMEIYRSIKKHYSENQNGQ